MPAETSDRTTAVLQRVEGIQVQFLRTEGRKTAKFDLTDGKSRFDKTELSAERNVWQTTATADRQVTAALCGSKLKIYFR